MMKDWGSSNSHQASEFPSSWYAVLLQSRHVFIKNYAEEGVVMLNVKNENIMDSMPFFIIHVMICLIISLI
jgi:hypothetical protein